MIIYLFKYSRIHVVDFQPRGVAVDEISGVVYYTDKDTSKIMAVTIKGNSTTQRTILDGNSDLVLRNLDVDYTKG